jgi:hypothetical protein
MWQATETKILRCDKIVLNITFESQRYQLLKHGTKLSLKYKFTILFLQKHIIQFCCVIDYINKPWRNWNNFTRFKIETALKHI